MCSPMYIATALDLTILRAFLGVLNSMHIPVIGLLVVACEWGIDYIYIYIYAYVYLLCRFMESSCYASPSG